MKNWTTDKAEETGAESQGSGKSTGFENVKNIIADKIHKAAEALGEKATNPDAHYGMAQYGKQASEWLDQSADYVREFDYMQADVRIREYVGQRPGRSLLIAGGVGLIIGAILRRR
ncbi:MAG: DUF883 C-terminal domain-containing protein [Desulfobacterales bacterium]